MEITELQAQLCPLHYSKLYLDPNHIILIKESCTKPAADLNLFTLTCSYVPES